MSGAAVGDPTQGKAPFMLQLAGCHGYDPPPRGLRRDRKRLALGWTEVVPGTFPTRLGILLIQPGLRSERVVCTTSHQEGEREGWWWVVLVEVGENFSEGIHCPLTERTA